MKKPKDHLYRLISAMSPSEKRYFKLHFGPPDNVLTELFDIVNSLSEYNEEVVKQRLGTKAAKNLKVHKIQLTDLLLKTLTLFQNKKSVYSKIRMSLEEVDLLIDKELHELAADRLAKLKKLCISYQEYAYLIEIVNREFRLYHIQYDKIGQSQWPIFEELDTYLERLGEQFKYAKLGNKLLDIKRKTTPGTLAQEEIDFCKGLLERDLFPLNYEPHSIRARLARNTTLTFIHDILGNHDISLQYRLNNVNIFREYPQYATHHSFDFLGTLRNLVNIYLQENQFEAAEQIIKEAFQFAETHSIHREQLVYFHYAELHIAFCRRNFEQIVQVIEPKLVAHLEQYDIARDRIGIITFLYLAITNLILTNHKKVHVYLRQLNETSDDLKAYFWEIFSIVEMISHFESEDHILMNNILFTKNRQVNKKKDSSPFYKESLKFFKKIMDQPTEIHFLAENFLSRVDKWKHDKVLGTFYYFHLHHWLLAKAHKRTFLEEMMSVNKKT